jgi:hypothetical protein
MALNFKDVAYSDTETKQVEQRIVEVSSARRHVVRVNGIQGQRKQFEAATNMKSRELIRVPVDSIALFCSEQIPSHFANKKYVTYIMTVNGIDYEIEPINSQRPGKKIIRHSELQADQPYAVYIKESIKSAYLTIIVHSHGATETPYLSNIKILYGRGGDYHGNV